MSARERNAMCGCCAGVRSETPLQIANRPGLSAIAYRVGVHSSFRKSMQAAISRSKVSATKLTTRDDDDFSIALLDAWAAAADVLTFYQERIANESYLRTARELRSLVELARLIGYEPAPAVAAETWLAFTLERGAQVPTTIPAGTKVQSVPGQDETAQTFESSADLSAREAWNVIRPRMTKRVPLTKGSTATWLAGTDTKLVAGAGVLFLGREREGSSGSELWDFRRVTKVAPDFDNGRTYIEWDRGLGSLDPPGAPSTNPRVYAMRVAATLFGANAPDPRFIRGAAAMSRSAADWPFVISGETVLVDGGHPEIRTGGWLVLTRPQRTEVYGVRHAAEISHTQYAVSGKATQVTLGTGESLHTFDESQYRLTLAFGGSEPLDTTEFPRTDDVAGQFIDVAIDVSDMQNGRALLVEGIDAESGAPASEPVFVDAVLEKTRIRLTSKLKHAYVRASVKIHGNAVAANHGESVREVLGGGNAARSFQQFRLKRAPVTYVSSSETPSGARSTLSVFVNDVRWNEKPTLYGAGPDERVYVTRRDDEQKTDVRFGDGKTTGSRLPTGIDNVRARYRVGAGRGGNVRPGQLSLLMTRPLGVKDVVNPGAASGGADAETIGSVRANAPASIRTLDRVVSLADYESFSAIFGGVGKALATWTWLGTAQQVLLTITGPAGERIEETSTVRKNLIGAIRKYGEPYVPLRVESYDPAYFRIDAVVRIGADQTVSVVEGKIREALETAFSFEARTFGQAVTLSEVIAVIHGVAGVVFVDVNVLHRSTDSPSLTDRLTARLPRIEPNGTLRRGEILMLEEWSAQHVRMEIEP